MWFHDDIGRWDFGTIKKYIQQVLEAKNLAQLLEFVQHRDRCQRKKIRRRAANKKAHLSVGDSMIDWQASNVLTEKETDS